ncbi:MAG: nitroreductase family protein [Muribaculaceae bacterium]
MKDIKELFEERRSIRRYERESIPDVAMETIYAAIRNTPTSYNGQQFSVIDIDDQELKEKIYDITSQKQIKTCNRFLVFCADYNKIGELAKEKHLNVPMFKDTLDGVMVGVIDAAMAMESAVIAAEACGLGSCCVGYTRTAEPTKIAELLKLPKGVFVVCGLAIGIPRERPDLKPKQSINLLIHRNHYRGDGMAKELLEYDKEVTKFNQNRVGGTSDNDWCAHILDYYRMALQYKMKDYIVEQGCAIIK